MAYKNKYQRQKQQYSIDGGSTWIDVSPANYRRGRLLEEASEDCNTIEWREVLGSWFCIGNEGLTRWVQTDNTICENYDSYYVEKEQISIDGGSTWSDTGETRTGSIAEYDSVECTESVDYSGMYFTIEVLEDCYVEPRRLIVDNLYVSFDDGATWNYSGDYGESEKVSMSNGDKMLLKREFTREESVYVLDIPAPHGYDYPYITMNYFIRPTYLKKTLSQDGYIPNYKMYGNVGSLAYGDDFANTDYSDKFFSLATDDGYSFMHCVSAYGVYIPKYWSADLSYIFRQAEVGTNADRNRLVKAPKTIDTYKGAILKGMFQDCTNLTIPPQLPSETLLNECYMYMFEGCTSLTTAPALPATTLAESCYTEMFRYCTSLVNAPVLPALQIASGAYTRMFANCSNLHKVVCLLESVNSNSRDTSEWLSSVPTDGEFIYNPINTNWVLYSVGQVPYQWDFITVDDSTHYSDWRVVDGYVCDGTTKCKKEREYISYDNVNWYAYNNVRAGEVIEYNSSDCGYNPSNEYLTIISNSDNNEIRFKTTTGSPLYKTISVSRNDGLSWTDYTSSTSGVVIANLNYGDKLLIKGNNATYGKSSDWTFFVTTGDFELRGNIMSLIYGDNFVGQTTFNGGTYNFYDLFGGCTGLISAENLVLPATTLTEGCYRYMFGGCTNLLATPALPATTLATQCYYEIFRGCTNITIAPALPATTLADECYYDMFMNCTSLVTAPELSATTLVYRCYGGMFSGCTSLDYIKMLATDISAGQCLSFWVSNVSATGTFVKSSSMTSLPTGASGIPSGWTVQDA